MQDSKLLGVVRKCIEEFSLINEGDKICVGVSGGKDSMSLLYALSRIQKFLPRKFELCAVNVDLGFTDIDKNKQAEMVAFSESLGVPLYIVQTEIGKIVFEERREKSPCSLCANMRRGALNNKAKELGCNKVALAHSMDDFIETLMLSLVYEGRISTIPIQTHLSRSEITVIRPLFYADDKLVRTFARNLPILVNPCPANKNTQRQYVRDLVAKLDRETNGGRDRMRTAVIDLVRNYSQNY